MILKGSKKDEVSYEHIQAAGWQSVVEEKDEELGFTDVFYIWLERFTDKECILFLSFGFLCLVPPAEHLRSTRWPTCYPDDRAPQRHTHSILHNIRLEILKLVDTPRVY